MEVSGVACSSSVRCVAPFATSLSSGSAFRSSSVQLVQLHRAASSVEKSVPVRSSLSEEQSVTRRDVLLSVLGVGTSVTFSGRALAANPGSLARQKKVEKPRPKGKKKPEEAKPEEAKQNIVEVKNNDTEIANSTSSSSPVESKVPEVSAIPEPADIPATSAVSAVPSVTETPSVQDVPTPTAAEAPAPKAETPNYDDFNLGDYFKDLF